MITMVQILKTVVAEQASDLHIVSESPPLLRIYGTISRIDHPALSSSDTKELCFSIITDSQKVQFERDKFLDFSFSLGKENRFRGHLFYQKGSIAGSFRLIQNIVPEISTLGLPQSITKITKFPYGLVLVTGPTGSGKSTTLASLIQEFNKCKKSHIVTIEDPIEYMHPHINCVVSQKELGQDIHSFSDGMKSVLREDPDICLIGELRDKITISSALHVAETGHLVLSTLHTNTAFDSIERLVGVFSGDEKQLIRNQLSNVIKAIVCQRLVPSVDGKRVLCYEIMYATTGIRNLIREGKNHQLYSQMQNQSRLGMVTFNQSLLSLVKDDKISIEQALEITANPKELESMIARQLAS